ncbi:MAG: hypothetical protein HQL26_00950 [Candidatus Omnitrophica bacterium]|nr:hypothetical protein [Candidatus Omnitrophota bacterium]
MVKLKLNVGNTVLIILCLFFVLGEAKITNRLAENKYQKLAQTLKADILRELKNNIKNEVWQEILHNHKKNFIQEKANLADSDIFTLNQGNLNDEDLDQYFAGNETPKALGINSGYTKLALQKSADEPSSSTLQTGTGEISGGNKRELPASLQKTFEERGSMLLPKGKFQLEPNFTYAHFSSNRINIQGFSILPVLVIGDISVQEVKRDVFINTYSLRYGLLNNLQAEIKVPGRFEHDLISTSTTSETTRNHGGLGDVELGLSRQIGWEHGVWPDLIAAFAVKTPSGLEPYNHSIALGTGHWAARGSLIAAKSSDPAVVFGCLSYTYNFARNGIENYGDVKPGDTIAYSLGTAVALSYKVALNLAFDQSLTTKMNRNGSPVVDSFMNSADLKAGLNWVIDDKKAVDFSVSMGLTKDSPDFTVEIRIPISF